MKPFVRAVLRHPQHPGAQPDDLTKLQIRVVVARTSSPERKALQPLVGGALTVTRAHVCFTGALRGALGAWTSLQYRPERLEPLWEALDLAADRDLIQFAEARVAVSWIWARHADRVEVWVGRTTRDDRVNLDVLLRATLPASTTLPQPGEVVEGSVGEVFGRLCVHAALLQPIFRTRHLAPDEPLSDDSLPWHDTQPDADSILRPWRQTELLPMAALGEQRAMVEYVVRSAHPALESATVEGLRVLDAGRAGCATVRLLARQSATTERWFVVTLSLHTRSARVGLHEALLEICDGLGRSQRTSPGSVTVDVAALLDDPGEARSLKRKPLPPMASWAYRTSALEPMSGERDTCPVGWAPFEELGVAAFFDADRLCEVHAHDQATTPVADSESNDTHTQEDA